MWALNKGGLRGFEGFEGGEDFEGLKGFEGFAEFENIEDFVDFEGSGWRGGSKSLSFRNPCPPFQPSKLTTN